MHAPITIEELDAAIIGHPLRAPAIKLPALDASMDLDELLEIASEDDDRGPLAAIRGLLEGLRVRRIDDDTTTSILAAIEHYHLPMLLDAERA